METEGATWRFIMQAFADLSPADTPLADALTDEQAATVGPLWAMVMLGPLADVAGRLAYRAYAAYRQAEVEAKYPEGAR